MAEQLVIDLHRVSKLYKRRVLALDDIAMQVRAGEIFGLLGPNGAGKTTLVKIMMSVVRPTRAEGSVLNHAIGSKASLDRVGYLPEHHRFPRYLTGRQTLEFFAALSHVNRPTRRKRAAELLETVGMTSWADSKVATYSKGMMQRIGIAQALVNDPLLVILDEPTDGVDPVGRREIRDVLLRLRSRGCSVFVNSHLLSELEMISDRVAILVAGRVVRQGTLDELTVNRQCFELEFALPARTEGAATQVLRTLAETCLAAQWPPPAHSAMPPAQQAAPPLKGQLPDGAWLEIENAILRIGTIDPEAIQPVIDAARRQGLTIRRIQQVRPSLEDLFIEAVGGIGGAHEAGAPIGRPVPPRAPSAGGRP